MAGRTYSPSTPTRGEWVSCSHFMKNVNGKGL
jgi:hypothetical protein